MLFFASFFISIIGFSFLLFYLTSGNSAPLELAGAQPDIKAGAKNILFCDVDNNVAYEFELDLEMKEYDVRRVFIDVGVYNERGLSGVLEEAENTLDRSFSFCLVASETQHAALLDYVGSVSRDIDRRLSEICGGISEGYHNLTGIAAINLYKYESENRELCLGISEEIFIKWCKELGDEASFFKLLDLTDNNISYTDFVENKDKINAMFNS